MRIPAVSLVASALLFSAFAQAQTLPPLPTPNPAMRQQFERTRLAMENIHRTERSQMLSALSMPHKQLLASIAGELATSANPDYDAAAKRIDAALSPAESQAILGAAQNARSQMRSVMEQMRRQLPPPPSGRFRERAVINVKGPEESGTPDPGRILLKVLMTGGFMDMAATVRIGPPHP